MGAGVIVVARLGHRGGGGGGRHRGGGRTLLLLLLLLLPPPLVLGMYVPSASAGMRCLVVSVSPDAALPAAIGVGLPWVVVVDSASVSGCCSIDTEGAARASADIYVCK